MNLVSLEIPDDREELAAWLERHMLGSELGALVAELSTIGDSSETTRLDDALGSSLATTLQNGLGTLSRDELQTLLRRPLLLLELQERIFIDGGEYWSGHETTDSATQQLANSHWEMISAGLDATLSDSAQPKTNSMPAKMEVMAIPWYRRPAVVSFATAAAVLVGVAIWQDAQPTAPPTSTAWGWNRPDAIKANLSAKDYLDSLANSANDWFNKRPETPEALATRIIQFRQGCSTLILSKHEPLAAEDRDWLVERCRAWAGKLDEHLAAIEAGDDVLDVRDKADETINKLMTAIHNRANEVS